MRKKIMLLLFIIFLGFLLFSAYKIINYHENTQKVSKEIESIQNLVDIEDVENTENTVVIPPEENISEFDYYWDYINMNLINVDFEELKQTNNETVGWIQVNGTNINYPFVQTKDNSYYLKHSFDKSYLTMGWIFLDYRNNLSLEDKNTIIYGHGLLNGSMFGSLRNTLTSNWLKEKDNYVIKLSTEHENTLWQVFSVYRIKTTSDYLKIDFESEEEFDSFISMVMERSNYDFNTSVSTNDRILTLSTCYNNTDKMVIHAKLIKKEVK